ncbi:MAG: YHS domain-containing protein [Polyangiaceae bacterium]
MRRSGWFLLWVASACATAACENEERPRPEKTTPAGVTGRPLAKEEAATGVCGMEEPAAKPGACGAGAECAGQACNGAARVEKAPEPVACGCKGHDTGDTERPIVPISEAKLGDRTRCPVTNGVFVVKPDSPKAEVDGKTYFFCCEGCVNRFKRDPKQFLET